MFKTHLLVALRHLRRQRGYAALHVAGLAVGLACCALIGLYVREELAYDDWHEHAERIQRIESDWGDFSLPATNWPFVEALRADYPQLEVATLLRSGGTVRQGERFFREENVLFANPAFFDVFSFRLAQGDPDAALAVPWTVVLSQAMAKKYFGEEDPIGQRLRFYGEDDVTVSGVLEDAPGPSHVQPDFLLSWSSLDAVGWTESQEWSSNSVNTYLLFPQGMDPVTIAADLPAVIERHAGDDWNGAALGLQPLTSIHLHSRHSAELATNGRMAYVVLFGAVAGFILLLACVNFMNLATARSLERAKEVGVRKSVGAQRGQLAGQFLAEATVLAVLGLIVAVGLVLLALPAFRVLADRPLALGAGTAAVAALAALGLTLVVGLLAGSYPALVLSGFRPAEVLRGRFAAGARGARLRQGLVVFQFAIAVVLLVGTLGVHRQLEYLRTADLGFDQAQVVTLPIPTDSVALQTSFVDALRQRPEVLAVATSSETFPSELLNGDGLGPVTAQAEADFLPTRAVRVGPGVFDVLGVAFLGGRDFRLGSAADSGGVVLNARAASRLLAASGGDARRPEALVGQEVRSNLKDPPLRVLGVVGDFHMATLHQPVEPTAFYMSPWATPNTFLVRVRPGPAEPAVEALRAAYAEAFPDALFEYTFTDQSFDAAYRTEERLGRLFSVFAGLAVFIACLGLFGLAAYATQRRTKEIGVRKVLGASSGSIVGLLSKDFARLVLIAVAVASPLAYLAMSRWLEGFGSHVELGPGPFLVAGALTLVLAVLTVSGQALRAATADPVTSLRTE